MEFIFRPSDHISVTEEPGCVIIGVPENGNLDDIISVVNFQLFYNVGAWAEKTHLL
jgi:hypothetical protein